MASGGEELATLAAEAEWLSHATDEEVQHLLHGLLTVSRRRGELEEPRLAVVLRKLVERVYSGGNRTWKRLTSESRIGVGELYRQLGSASAVRHSLLQLLSESRSDEDLELFVELVVRDPPVNETAAALAMGPLFRH